MKGDRCTKCEAWKGQKHRPYCQYAKKRKPTVWIDMKKGPDPRTGGRYIVKVKVGGQKIIVGSRYLGVCLWSLDLPAGKYAISEVTHYMKVPK